MNSAALLHLYHKRSLHQGIKIHHIHSPANTKGEVISQGVSTQGGNGDEHFRILPVTLCIVIQAADLFSY